MNEYDPAISGDLVSFTRDLGEGNTNVGYYDIASGTEHLVTTAPGRQELSDVSGPLIAYTDLTTRDVRVYDTRTGADQNLTADSDAPALNPAISGDLVAWEDLRTGGREIWAQRLGTGGAVQLSQEPGMEASNPAVSPSGLVVWESCKLGFCDIQSYDWTTGARHNITNTPSTDDRQPELDGHTVVYEGRTPGGYQVHAYDLATGIDRTLSLMGGQVEPHVSNGLVAFADISSGLSHVRLWDLATGGVFDLSQASSSQFLDDIDGYRVVYTDDRGGQLDVWMSELTHIPQAITFTSIPSDYNVVGGSYMVAATGGGSGNPVVFSIDPASTSVCSLAADNVTVSFDHGGTCVIDANQAGNPNYDPAPQAQQTLTIEPAEEQQLCTTNTGSVTLSPGLTSTPTVQTMKIKGTLAGCEGEPFTGAKYSATLKTAGPVACPVLKGSGETAAGGAKYKWTPKAKPSQAKGTLSLLLTETSGAAFSGQVTTGSYAPLTLSGTATESYVGGPTCGEPVGKKAAKAVKKGTFSGSAVSFE